MKIINKEPLNEILRPVNRSDNLQTRIICIIIVLLTACTSTSLPLSDPPNAERPVPVPQQGESPEMTSTTSYAAGLQNLMEKAKTDIAQRLNISKSQISVVEVREVVWPDASLGCPQPGMEYIQVPEDGALIILQVGGINYEYHYGGGRGLFLCEKAYKNPTPPPKIDIFNLTPPKTDSSTPNNSIPPGENQ